MNLIVLGANKQHLLAVHVHQAHVSQPQLVDITCQREALVRLSSLRARNACPRHTHVDRSFSVRHKKCQSDRTFLVPPPPPSTRRPTAVRHRYRWWGVLAAARLPAAEPAGIRPPAPGTDGSRLTSWPTAAPQSFACESRAGPER